MERITFAIRSKRHAELQVADPGDPAWPTLGVGEGTGQCYRIGYRDATLFSLMLDIAEEKWEIEACEGGHPALREPLPDTEWARQLAAWVAGSRVTRSLGLVDQLPAGSYHLVRSPRRAVPASRVLLGNTWVEEVPPNFLVLEPGSDGLLRPPPTVLGYDPRGKRMRRPPPPAPTSLPVHALIVGPHPATPPRLDQPLLGIVILDYQIVAPGIGVVLFACGPQDDARLAAAGSRDDGSGGDVADAGEAADARDTGDAGDLILLVPATGELVLSTWSGDKAEAERKAWASRRAMELVRLLGP